MMDRKYDLNWLRLVVPFALTATVIGGAIAFAFS
jgi:hypothetical protein